jgi:hypothetical protein
LEPTREQLDRASAALIPFVQEWKLPLNPEDLDEIAYAVLTHHDSTASYEEIDAAAREQISQVREAHQRMRAQMGVVEPPEPGERS